MDNDRLKAFVDRDWDELIIPALSDYIRIPNKSPAFDPDWEAHGHMDRAVEALRGWAETHSPAGSVVEVVRLPGLTPLLMIECPGTTRRFFSQR